MGARKEGESRYDGCQQQSELHFVHAGGDGGASSRTLIYPPPAMNVLDGGEKAGILLSKKGQGDAPFRVAAANLP